jgi:uncharacterized membrane protein
VVIGNFWLANHRFVSRVAAMSRQLVYVILIYLAFVAFLPFPSAVLGAYSDNAVGVAFYAVSIAFVSGFEAVMFWVAWRQSLLMDTLSPSAFRWAMFASLVPVAMFLVSVPIAFASPILGIVTWLVTFPVEAVLERYRPAEMAKY